VAGDQGDSGHGNDDADGGAMDQALRSAALMYAGDRAAKALGISIDEVAPGRATARMRVTGDMTNGHRIAHGGYIFLVADAAFAYACNSYGPVTVAQACQITFLRPAREGDELIAVAAERVRMERNGIYDISVCRADGEVLADGAVTAGRCSRTPAARARATYTCASGRERWLHHPAGAKTRCTTPRAASGGYPGISETP